MDSRESGRPVLDSQDRIVEASRNSDNGGGVVEDEGVEDDLDLFGDEDDEIFSRISEDVEISDSIAQSEQSQLSKSGVQRPSSLTPVNNFNKVTPQSKALEKLPDFDEEAGATWIYPVNYPLRDYQFSMVEKALFQNTLISLPTGLGKTFIAAVVMYNFYRWYPTCKVVFMAPTKPLVAQQVEACFNIMGIPQSDISQMTGTLNPNKRIQQWTEKRVFFLTPQVIDNDLSRGTCPAKLIRCLVLDEAHRALGNHAYCQVVRGLREHGHDFRILALSATPGSDMLAVKQVLMNLFISHIEIRNEDSTDLQEYTFQRNIEKVVVPLGEELTILSGKYLKVLRMYVNKLNDFKVLYARNEASLTKFQLLKSRDCFRQNPPSTLPRHKFGAVEGVFALCMTLCHAYELLMQHGIRSFYRFLKETLSNEKSHYFARSELRSNGPFQSLMNDLSKKFEVSGGAAHSSKQEPSILFSQVGPPVDSKMTPKAPFIISHPKMAKLLSIVTEHHQKFADEDKSTRVMVFSQYRDSVLEITEMLQQHYPLVKAMSFIGHNKVGQNGKGLTQKKQIQVVSKFRDGGYNTLVSTCVGEEGLDIGDVDLIICYDAPKSPIRLVQRMGRTGRKREGRIVVLLTSGKEEQSYNSSQYKKKAINTALGNSSKLAHYLVPNSPRMVPRGLSPSCLKLHMKEESWQTNTKVSKSSLKGRGSLLSMPAKTSTSSRKSSSERPLMTEEEWQWYKNIKVPWNDVKKLPPASLMCLDASKREFDCTKHIDLGSYQPWQSLPQHTHVIGHSQRTLHLVELTEFIHLHQHFGSDEDPYGLEMAAFLDKAYVQDDDDCGQLTPDFKKAANKHISTSSQEDGKVKKVKKLQNSIGSKRKKAKVVQSSLITDMFSRLTKSEVKPNQENHQKSDIVPSQKCSQNNAENDKMSLNGKANLLNVNSTPDGDDDVICLMDDNVNVAESTPVVKDGSQSNRKKGSRGTTEASKVHRLDQIPFKKSPDERVDCHKEALFLPVLCGGSLPLEIELPPLTTAFQGDEIEEPNSPSEVFEFCRKWLTENIKMNANEAERNGAAPQSRDMFEVTMEEKVLETNEHSINNNKNNVVGDHENEQLQGTISALSIGEVSPVIGKSSCIRNTTADKTDGNKSNIYCSTNGSKAVTGIFNVDASPILGGRNNSLQSSTPKTVSKHLFKGNTLGLSTIDEFSPISKNQDNIGVTLKFHSPSITMGKRKEENKCEINTANPSDAQKSLRQRFQSKLSRFARPEESEVEFITEISSANKEKDCGKSFSKNLFCEGFPAKVSQPEGLIHRPNQEPSKVSDVTSSFSKLSECKNTSSFLFDDLSKVNACKNNENQTFAERKKEVNLNNNNSKSVKDLSQASCNSEREDSLKRRKETTTTQNEKNQQNVHKGARLACVMDSKAPHGETSDNVSNMMENCSVFAHIDDHELEARRSSTAEKYEESSSGLTVTQVLHFMNDKDNHESQNVSTNTLFPRLSSSNSKTVRRNLTHTAGNSSRKLSLSLRKTNHESKANKSAECDDIEVLTTSPDIDGNIMKFSNKTLLGLSSKSSDFSSKQTTEPRKTTDDPKEKHVSFHCQENVFDVSESLFADADFDLVEMPDISDVQTRNVVNGENSSCALQSFAEDCSESNRTYEGTKDQSSVRLLSRNKQNISDDSSKLMSPTQETQLLVRRKQKKYNVLQSDEEDSLASSGKERDTSTSTVSDNSRISRGNECVTTPLRKAVANHLRSEFDDGDWDFVEEAGCYQPQKEEILKKKRKRKRMRIGYLDDEAEVSMGAQLVSSDESEDEEMDYDRSFVDDGTYLSQDNKQDMKAIYLRSVVSPMRPKLELHHRPPLKYIHGSENSEAEEDEELGSFVVDNSFVEYETEYVGETMLAEDPIIQEVLENQGKTKKIKDDKNGNKAKRKRIVMNESSSDEDSRPDNKILKQTPMKNIQEQSQPLHQTKKIHVESQGKKACAAINNKDEQNCLLVDLDDDEEFDTTEWNPLPARPQCQLNKFSSGKSSLSSNRDQKYSSSTVKTQALNPQEKNKSSDVKLLTNNTASVVNGQQLPQQLGREGTTQGLEDVGSGGGNSSGPSTLLHPVLRKSSVPAKDGSMKRHEGLNTSVNAGTLPSPVTSPVSGCVVISSSSTSPLNASSSMFVASTPVDKSLTSSQTVINKAPQESVAVLVDTSEVKSGGRLMSRLRLHYGVQTAVVPLKHAHYAVSTRMAVSRLTLAMLSIKQHKARLIERIQGMLELYEAAVIIVEPEEARGSPVAQRAIGRSQYLDTIVCACAQVTRIKLLYSKGQEETSHLLWQLLSQEKAKGFKISTDPPMNNKRKQMVTFYLTLPSIGYPTAIAFAQNFSTIKEFLNSTRECIMKKGGISIQKATALKQHIAWHFTEDLGVT